MVESLNRIARQLKIDENTPLMTMDQLLNKMVRQGYIDKVKDMVTGEARYDYHLGPRGKLEVGKRGTTDLIKHVLSLWPRKELIEGLWR